MTTYCLPLHYICLDFPCQHIFRKTSQLFYYFYTVKYYVRYKILNVASANIARRCWFGSNRWLDGLTVYQQGYFQSIGSNQLKFIKWTIHLALTDDVFPSLFYRMIIITTIMTSHTVFPIMCWCCQGYVKWQTITAIHQLGKII